jgi:SAM-dependent methyltransferase
MFDEDAELYDRARPTYPPALVDDLVAWAGIGPQSRILEIGPGTGQLTVPLARTGARIVAIELGADLAAVARRNLADRPRAEVIVSSFEEWPLPAEPFDAVVAATAFHWLDPAVRIAKSAAALRPGGTLATVTTAHVAGGTPQFFRDAQECYRRWDPASYDGPDGPPDPATVTIDWPEIDRSDYFESPPEFRQVQRDIHYSTHDYLDTLLTYSGHRAMSDEARERLLSCIRALIDTRYGGHVTKRYLHGLRMAHRNNRPLADGSR